MIYIKVDGEWYITKYKRYNELKMYETGHAQAVYDSNLDEVVAKEIWHHERGYEKNPMTDEQVKLELFLQGEKFHEWSMDIYRFGHNLTSDRMNEKYE